MISTVHDRRKRVNAPALCAVRMSWTPLPVVTGDVRPDAAAGYAFGADVDTTAPGPLTWSPPI